jgi:hypothetical protein
MSGSAARVGSGEPFLRVVSPADLGAAEASRLAALSELNKPPPAADLGAFVRRRWEAFRNHRNSGDNPINERLLRAQRMFEGRYDPSKLSEIRKFGGSEVYSRLVAVKCRGANSLLRDVYLGSERPWTLSPPPDPEVPAEIRGQITRLVSSEAQNAQLHGQNIDPDAAHFRFLSLMHGAIQAAKRNSADQAALATDKVHEILEMGGFYDAFAEFLVDLPLFPYAVIKGPVVRMIPKLTWEDGRPNVQNRPQMFWERVSPFDFYWSPGSVHIENSEIIERQRLTRTDLNDLLGLPGYDEDAVRGALNDYDRGLRDWLDSPDTEAALLVGREDPHLNESNMIEAIEYHGNVQGRKLLDEGLDVSLIPDPDRDYAVQTWVVGRHTLKTQLNPSPRQRHPYYMTSFEKIPGTALGHGLPDILEDLQEIGNATLRALVNNMAIASGPQVVVNTERLSPTENADQLYPWKRWHVVEDPLGSSREPITFFQPQSNSQELLAVYGAINGIADDISAIPRYATGESLKGGAGRTASGLSMLMNNSSKVLQTVASNVDIDVMKPLLTSLYDMIMLTDDSGMLTGQEEILVNGVTVALQKESERQKQLQFLQITGNPLDASIVGELGRARVLRSVASNMGLPDDIVPSDTDIQARMQREQMMKAQLVAATASGAGMPGGPPGQGQQDGEAGSSEPDPAAAAQGGQGRQATPERLADFAPPQNDFQAFGRRGVGRRGP